MEIQECSLPGFYCSRLLGLAPYLIKRNKNDRIDKIQRSPWLCIYSICFMTATGKRKQMTSEKLERNDKSKSLFSPEICSTSWLNRSILMYWCKFKGTDPVSLWKLAKPFNHQKCVVSNSLEWERQHRDLSTYSMCAFWWVHVFVVQSLVCADTNIPSKSMKISRKYVYWKLKPSKIMAHSSNVVNIWF